MSEDTQQLRDISNLTMPQPNDANQPTNASFCEKLEATQYKAALAITGAIQGTSRDRIYE